MANGTSSQKLSNCKILRIFLCTHSRVKIRSSIYSWYFPSKIMQQSQKGKNICLTLIENSLTLNGPNFCCRNPLRMQMNGVAKLSMLTIQDSCSCRHSGRFCQILFKKYKTQVGQLCLALSFLGQTNNCSTALHWRNLGNFLAATNSIYCT